MNWHIVPIDEVSNLIARHIERLLKNGPVTWFLSGGSNVKLEAKTLQLLQNSSADLSKLTILLVDERFGLVGHDDSNWYKLQNAGFMIKGPHYIQAYMRSDITLKEAVTRYEEIIARLVSDGSYLFAQLGLGIDGHTAGILPGSPAAVSDRYVCGYESEPYQRLTTTFKLLQKCHEVMVVAYGKDKWPQLKALSQTIDKKQQPVQVIKDISRVTIYTDYEITKA